ncbi:MAG: N-acetylglucosamine-6-phosphate deacetylase [Hyphomonadaceae bacterium]|nr:N-acetylglucosamine-6-phosphate deacetylase [Hyphomonadaceae bacterium]
MTAFAPSRLFTGAEIIEGAVVHIDNGRVTSVSRTLAPDAVKLDGLLAPGFIDAQVNGGGGVLFNDAPTVDTLEAIAAAHSRFGVTSFMATLISDERGKIPAAIAAVEEGVRRGVPGLLGLHLEGPWLSEPRRGVHPAKHLRPLADEDIQALTRTRAFPLLVTVAPEQAAPIQIKALSDAGIIVSLGHTAATAEEVQAALAAGAAGFTHLFNAMPPIEGRKPGPVGAALADPDCFAGLILDGVHVHPVSAKLALAAKTARRLVLVSDAMSTVGAAGSSMQLFGETIAVQGGALRTSAGVLAGAHLDMSAAMRNAVTLLGASLKDALRMASLTPAEFLRVEIDRGRIAPGLRADFVLLNDALEPAGVWIAGERVA